MNPFASLEERLEQHASEWEKLAAMSRKKGVEDEARVFDARDETYRICAKLVREDKMQKDPDLLIIPHIIDGGCTTLQGLMDRCSMFQSLYGPGGKISNHTDGFLYESKDGYRVLVKLTR